MVVSRAARGFLVFWWVSALLFSGISLVGTVDIYASSSAAEHRALVEADTKPDSLREAMEDGVAAYARGDYEAAFELLGQVYEQEPAYRLAPQDGTAAYWLGRSVRELGNAPMALQIWETAVGTAMAARQMDLRSADAYVRSVFSEREIASYPRAADVYLLILEYADAEMSSARAALVSPYLEQLEPVLPANVRASTLMADSEGLAVNSADAGGGALAAWWRSQNPEPATTVNERVIEHLGRVAHALDVYPDADSPTGFDQRGEIYVRLGPPDRQHTVDLYTRELTDRLWELRRAIGNNLVVNPSDFHETQFWFYHDDDPFYYLFVDKGAGFKVGEIADIVPQHLRTGNRNTGRGAAKADIVLEVLRSVYRQLATYHLDFSERYIDLDNYLGRLEELRMQLAFRDGQDSFQSRERRADYSTVMQQDGAPLSMQDPPDQMLRSALNEARRQDQVIAYRRDERVPPAETNTLDDIEPLDVAVRTARFLDDDGSTRTKVLWGARIDQQIAGGVDASPQLISLTVNHLDEDYRRRGRYRQGYAVPAQIEGIDVLVPSEPLEISTSEDHYHLNMQWDRRVLETDAGDGAEYSEPVGSAMARADSLDALGLNGHHLEVSDLMPVLLDENSMPLAEADRGLPGQPYPFAGITPEMSVALYFEIYNLTFGADDHAQYTVEYDIHRRTERGGLGRIFRGDLEHRTATQVTGESMERRSSEFILLDLSEPERPGELVVTVRVTDQVTGDEVERVIDFAFSP